MSNVASGGVWAIFINEIDMNRIGKGSFISPDTLERVTTFKRGSNEYDLQVLRVKGLLEAHFDESGNPVTIKIEQEGLRVLTDEEATEYNHRRFKIGMRALFEANRRMSNVDEGKMTSEQVAAHRAKLNAQAHVVTAVANKNDTLRLIPYSRQVPNVGYNSGE